MPAGAALRRENGEICDFDRLDKWTGDIIVRVPRRFIRPMNHN